jgi:uncharacterized protein YbaR (Trm112 family)/SAM-dependent methyltransferase
MKNGINNMKYRLLELLCCPDCNSSFELDVYLRKMNPAHPTSFTCVRCVQWCAKNNCSVSEVTARECMDCYQDEISDGKLNCPACNKAYPVIKGIPRILSQTLLAQSLRTYHPDFLKHYGQQFPTFSESMSSEDERIIQTLHTFSYQWTTFLKNFIYFKEIFLSFIHPFLDPDDFRDRLVLEVGCGSGRPASVALSFGAELVAMDLSEAVQSAHSLVSYYPLLHVVQADIYHIPFKPLFDFVYSVGVMQHLPDPALGFKSIAKTVPDGHRLIVWVYGKRESWYRPVDLMRKFTSRLSYGTLHILSIILATISEGLFLIPYRVLSRISVTRRIAERIPGRIYARFPFQENVLGWFDRLGAPITHYFSEEDIRRMFEDAGFNEIEVAPRPGAGRSWVGHGRK